MKRTFPLRYFITETVPEKWEDFKRVCWDDPKYQLKIRFGRKYNRIKMPRLSLGYYDVSERMLHSSFELLVEFVEKDIGARNYDSDKRSQKELGLEYIEWCISDADCNQGPAPTQADQYREIKLLYNWWVYWRPSRREPWSCKHIWEEWRNEDHPALATGQPHERADYLESTHRIEDDEMMARLSAIRPYLWS